MAAPSSYMWRKFLLVQLAVCFSVSFIAAISSTSPEPEVRTYNILASDSIESKSIFGTSHGHQSLTVSTAHVNPRRASAWSTRIRQLRSQAAANSGDYADAWRSTFKTVSDCYARGITLAVTLDGTAEFTNIQKAIDNLEPDFIMKRATIDVTSGVHEEKVIIPASMPLRYFTMQGEGRIRIICWKGTAGNLKSASAIVELCDHASFRSTAEAPAPNLTNRQAEAILNSGDKAFLITCANSTATMTPWMITKVVFTTSDAGSDALFKVLRALLLVTLKLISRDAGCTQILMPTRGALPQGERPWQHYRTIWFSVQCNIRGTGMPYLGRAYRSNIPVLSTPV